MKAQVKRINATDNPGLAQTGVLATVIVSTPRNKHYLFYAFADGLHFIYGGESRHSRPSAKVVSFAQHAVNA